MDQEDDEYFPPEPVKSVVEKETIGAVRATSHFPPKRLRVKLTLSEGVNSTTRTVSRQLVVSQLGKSPSATASRRSVSTVEPRLPPAPPPSISSPNSKPPGLMLMASNKRSNGDPKVHRRKCHCKQSKCVKLYCECFASGAYCDGCSCIDCQNNAQNEAIRMAAVEIILERKPNAFTPKIGGNPCGTQVDEEVAKNVEKMGKHNRGCHCKKTGCVKKYCECFQANISCSENCRCSDCKNSEGCEERMVVFGRGFHYSKTYIQQTDATISSASSEYSYYQKFRRKYQEFLISNKDSSIKKLKQDQVNPSGLTTIASKSIDPASCVVVSAASGSLKFAYSFSGLGTRSLMADVIRLADTRGLCSVLVVASETAKLLTEKNVAEEVQKAKENLTTNVLEAPDRRNWEEKPLDQKMKPENGFNGNQNNGIGTDDFRSDGSNIRETTAFPTERDELMCKDKPFTESAFSEQKKKKLSVNFMETQETSRKRTTCVLATQDMKTYKKVRDHHIIVPDNCLSKDHSDTVDSDYSRSNSTDVQEGRPFPPERDEQICDEDKSFIKAAFPNQNLRNDCSSVYIEQERHVLTCFREFLWQLIIFGTEKEGILSGIQLENLRSSRKLG